MNFKKITAITLLLATALFAQAMAAVDHVHLDVVGEQECVICGSTTTDALLTSSLVPAIVPASALLVEARVRSSHLRTVTDLRSRAPPIFLVS